MATDLSAISPAAKTQDVALDGTAGNCEEVTLPTWCRRVTISFVQNDKATADAGSIAAAGTDGAAQSDDAMLVGSGGAYEYVVSPNRARNLNGTDIYLAATTNTAFARLDMDT